MTQIIWAGEPDWPGAGTVRRGVVRATRRGRRGAVEVMGGQAGSGMMASGTCEVVEGPISPMGWCILCRPLSG